MIDSKTAQKKLRIASDLFELAVRIKTHQLKQRHPLASDAEVRALVIALIEKGGR